MSEDGIYIYDNVEDMRPLIEAYWGHDTRILTEKHIEALREGKILAWTDEEYTTSITLEKGEEK